MIVLFVKYHRTAAPVCWSYTGPGARLGELRLSEFADVWCGWCLKRGTAPQTTDYDARLRYWQEWRIERACDRNRSSRLVLLPTERVRCA